MTRTALSSSIAERIAEIRRATDDLVRAVEQRDEQGIDDALQRRSAGIAALEPQIRDYRRQEGAMGDVALQREAAELTAGAALAERELRRMLEESRTTLLRWLEEARAIRSYETPDPNPAVLDRSG